ncbi:F0F1 ATP synthase subunit gamma [Legionella fallonii]|uniref:ATP synthase subunit gamma n=1 Tax=Legionella fallonii LLAP-10 TaxID=1212491 RepID=A0A098G5M1_9GAMM|nr:F0F1 ATP synthase subunit gamma [Legionella fallonii]CEG57752.1 ATP synthase subunit gamma [Legionella fallonii LLAP-10]
MTKRAQLKDNLHTLEDIGNIMTAMKNLCSIEISKMTKFLSMQDRVMESILEVKNDFFSAYPVMSIPNQEVKPLIYILIGSERGFCGGFNNNILSELERIKEQNPNAVLIIVGRKLALKLNDDSRVVHVLEGPNVLEEIPSVILKVLKALEEVAIQRHLELRSGQWNIIFNEEQQDRIYVTTLQPFKEFFISSVPDFSVPPVLNLSRDLFLAEFIDNYLFAMFHSVFYKSFFVENHQRFFHLNHALDRLDRKKSDLKGHLKLVRQEEITEEIQIIMLSAEALINQK